MTRSSVWEAVRLMGPYKDPGLDEFPAIFYQRNWDVVGPDVVLLFSNMIDRG